MATNELLTVTRTQFCRWWFYANLSRLEGLMADETEALEQYHWQKLRSLVLQDSCSEYTDGVQEKGPER